jgi:hypothetical protein
MNEFNEKQLLIMASGHHFGCVLTQENRPRACSKSDIQELIKSGLIDSVNTPLNSDGSTVKYVLTESGRLRLNELGYTPPPPNPAYL